MSTHIMHECLPGYEKYGTICIRYNIPGGKQGPEHPNPGHYFNGTSRPAYLPNSPEGQKVARLLRKAFDAGLVFTVGTSHTTGAKDTVVWNDIHHKTSTHGGPERLSFCVVVTYSINYLVLKIGQYFICLEVFQQCTSAFTIIKSY